MPASQRRSSCAVPIVALLTVSFLQACANSGGAGVAKGLSASGPYQYNSKYNLIHDWLPRNEDGTLNVIIEIPTGTSEKWEVSEDGSALVREFTGEKPRVINYLPYPGNYGMVPRTLIKKEDGGDGSPLDVMVLGPAVPRGSRVRARAIGLIRVFDRGEQDDKILAVMQGETMNGVYDVESLRLRYPGAAEIITTWWANAHGRNSQVEVFGTASRGVASGVINAAIDSYKHSGKKR